MSTKRHPIRKRQQIVKLPRNALRQLRPLVPKGTAPFPHPVQHRLHLEHNNIWNERDTVAVVNVKSKHSAVTSQSYTHLKPVSSGHGSTLRPLERKQYATVCPNMYSNRVPLIPADDCFPELAPGDTLLGARLVAHEVLGLWAQHLPHCSSQRQETTQNRRGGDYYIPKLHAPEDAVWTTIVQPTSTISIYQSQCDSMTLK